MHRKEREAGRSEGGRGGTQHTPGTESSSELIEMLAGCEEVAGRVSLSAGGGFSVAGGVTGLVEGGCTLDVE